MKNVLFISNHDYRSSRRANIHFIAKESTKIFDRVSFFSIGYSPLSKPGKEVRKPLDASANRWEMYDGVHCYLWKTAFHPGRAPRPALAPLSNLLYALYTAYPSRVLDEAIAEASVIVLESGLSPVFIDRVVRAGGHKRIIYIASDRLETISVHPNVMRDLNRGMQHFDIIRIPARSMAVDFTQAMDRVRFIPHGIDKEVFDTPGENPYQSGRNAVSIGSMLFDAHFFHVVAPQFPDITFHVIGSKQTHAFPANVIQYDEMPFLKTINYIKHATIGLAPYRAIEGGEYLSDSSMKLRQYGYAGLPAVCSDFAASDLPLRFGYDPHDDDSMIAATRAALAEPKQRIDCLEWSQVAEQLYAAPGG